jgi:hypothetical protein
VKSNDEVERRGLAPPVNEDALSQSSTPSLAYRRCYHRDRSNRLLDDIYHEITWQRARLGVI